MYLKPIYIYNMRHTRQVHTTHTNEIGKRLNKVVFLMVLDQRKMTCRPNICHILI